MYRNFDEMIAEGEKDMMNVNSKDIIEAEENLKKDNTKENIENI
jgi:hypothetical protein